MAKRPLWDVTVASTRAVTPNMRRIELTGDSLAGFPQGAEGGYVKLLLSDEPLDPDVTAETLDPKPFTKRSYTVRAFDPASLTLTLDFCAHADGGPATAWCTAAKPGDRIFLVGPGPVKMLDPTADWFFLAGDMTALPAIQCNLQRLPPDARGYAVVSVSSDADRALPEGRPTASRPTGSSRSIRARTPSRWPTRSARCRGTTAE